MLFLPRNAVLTTLVAIAAIALSLAQPMASLAFACQLQAAKHHNCCHGASESSAAHHLAETHSTDECHTAAHHIDKSARSKETSTQQCHPSPESHPSPPARWNTQPRHADHHFTRQPDVCKCSSGDAPFAPVAFRQASPAQNDFSVPVSTVSLPLPQLETGPLWRVALPIPIQREPGAQACRAPPK
ncbi:MAG TPA: hypothetical protein VF600_09415 [Abditibacteriaceae bacterium]